MVMDMKTSFSPQGVRIIGKSWEIRARLREWSSSSLTLQQFLQRQFLYHKANSLPKKTNNKRY